MTARTTGPHLHWHGEPGAVWFPLVPLASGRGERMLGCCVAGFKRNTRGLTVAVVGASDRNDWVNDLFTQTALGLPADEPERQIEMRIWPLTFGGRSCGLALALAEQLCRHGRAVPRDTMIVATGTVTLEGRGLCVGRVDGLSEKLALILEEARPGTLVLLPKANELAEPPLRRQLDQLTAGGIIWRAVDLFTELSDLWAAPAKAAAAPAAEPIAARAPAPPRAQRSKLRPVVAGTALGIALLGGLAFVAAGQIEDSAWRTRIGPATDAAFDVGTTPTAAACGALATHAAALAPADRDRLGRDRPDVAAATARCATAADAAAAHWRALTVALDGAVGRDAAAARAVSAAAAAITALDRGFPPAGADVAALDATVRKVAAGLAAAEAAAAGVAGMLTAAPGTPDAATCRALDGAAATLDGLGRSVLAADYPEVGPGLDACRAPPPVAAAPEAPANPAPPDRLGDRIGDRLAAATAGWVPGMAIDAAGAEALLAEIDRDGRDGFDAAARAAEIRLRHALAAETVRGGAVTRDALAALPLAVIAGAAPEGVVPPLDAVAAALADAGLTLVAPGVDAMIEIEVICAVLGAGDDNALGVPAASVRATLVVRWAGTGAALIRASADSNGFDPRSIAAAITANLGRAARGAAADLLAKVGA